MKIKCPGCAAMLQIPDSAAGKVVKCTCGKQMRAPALPQAAAGAAGGSAGSAAPAPSRPVPSRPVQSRPLASAAPVAVPGLFDELTETDLEPVKAVQIPGGKVAVKAPNAGTAKMLNEAISGGSKRGEALAMQGLAPRPGFLIFVAVVNAVWSLIYFGSMLLLVGLLAFLPALAEEVPDAEGMTMYVAAGVLGVLALLSIATCISCFVRGKASWYVILFSYAWGFADRVMGVVQMVVDGNLDAKIGGAIGGILFGAGIWAYMHGDDVRAFHGTHGEPIGKIIGINAAGFVIGAGLGAAAVFMN